jgi:hypothetical protein
MVTFLIIAAVLSVGVGLWLLNQKHNEEIKEVNNDPWTDDLAPEVTPAPIAEIIAKKKAEPKKKAAAKKPAAKKVVKKAQK